MWQTIANWWDAYAEWQNRVFEAVKEATMQPVFIAAVLFSIALATCSLSQR